MTDDKQEILVQNVPKPRYVREARHEDVEFLSSRIRQEDLAEIFALRGIGPLQALEEAFCVSELSYVVVVNEEVAGMFGSVDCGQSLGMIWMLGSDRLTSDRRWFLSETGHWLRQLHERNEVLFNYVDARNSTHIRWIEWAGFEFLRRHDHFGHERRTFYEFRSVS